jgi:hypothetical protein
VFNKKIVFQNSLFCGQLSKESGLQKFKLHYSKPKITKCAKTFHNLKTPPSITNRITMRGFTRIITNCKSSFPSYKTKYKPKE